MSEYWKSTAKKFCDYCKIWIADNKASINIHESGRKHQENVKAKLAEIKKKSNEKNAEEMKTAKAMAAIEKAAMDAMKKDLSSNPKLKNQYGSEAAKAAEAAAAALEVKEKKPEKSSVKPSTSKAKSSSSSSSTTPANQAVKRKAEESEGKIGKWEAVSAPKKIITAKTEAVDLQLPNSASTIPSSKFESTVEQLQSELESLDKEITEAAPKPKWNTSGFQPIEPEESKPKQETVVSVKEEKEEEEAPIKKEEPEESYSPVGEPITQETNTQKEEQKEKPVEKVVTLDGMFKSSKKPIAFKKRKTDSIRLRERMDD